MTENGRKWQIPFFHKHNQLSVFVNLDMKLLNVRDISTKKGKENACSSVSIAVAVADTKQIKNPYQG